VLALAALVLVLLDYAADPWWTIVLILSALVGCALAIVWFAGLWPGRVWRLRLLVASSQNPGQSWARAVTRSP